MAVTNWAFPNLEAKPGAWRRYWVVLVAFPNLYREIFAGSTLESFCLGMADDPLHRKLLDSYMRARARKEKHALKALQNGTDVRDIPGADTAIQAFKTRFDELNQENAQGLSEQQLPLLVERLSSAVCDYTFCEDMQPRIADRVIGPSGRNIADALAQQWLEFPLLKYLKQRFHPRAHHLRFDSLDAVTLRQPSDPSAVQRPPGQLPRYGAPHGGTNPHTFPYVTSFIGPVPPIPDPTSGLHFPQAPLLQFACTRDLFDPVWAASPEQAREIPFHFDQIPPLSFNRVYQVNTLENWRELVRRYPLEFTNLEVRQEFQRLSGKDAVFLGVDWERVRQDYDVVFFGFAAVLDCADVGVDIEASELGELAQSCAGARLTAVMYRVVPGSTYWLNL